ncbi:MAG: NAD(P)H-dependent oxidoreductase [Gallionellaceae bacterium]
MKQLLVLSCSVRRERHSHGVAVYLADFVERKGLAKVERFDLKAANFPVFEERLQFLPDPPAMAAEFGKAVQRADAVIIVSPEYNLSVPAATKNAIDLLGPEWNGKAVGIAAVSSGTFGARNAWAELSKILLHLGARPSSAGYFTPTVQNFYSESGLIVPDTRTFDDRAQAFVESILDLAG